MYKSLSDHLLSSWHKQAPNNILTKEVFLPLTLRYTFTSGMGLHHNSNLHISKSLHVSQPSHPWVRDISHPPTYSYSTFPAPHHPHSLSYKTEIEDGKDQETIWETWAIMDLLLCLPVQPLIYLVLPSTLHSSEVYSP